MKRRLFITVLLFAVALRGTAVPARGGWQTLTQPDGSTIEVEVKGDELYHYTVNREGQQVKKSEGGGYEVVGAAPSAAVVQARRTQAKVRRQRKETGVSPNLAPRGVVLIINFSDKELDPSHTTATFDELCNSRNCTVNEGYPSAAQYFADQSNGGYRPIFDVYGPVTLCNGYAYYGENIGEDGDDKYATDAVIEACILANEQYSDLDFTQYDSDNDGYVDFIYVIYAGKGEADGGNSNTIWPHNWSVQEQIDYAMSYPDEAYSIYEKSDTRLDGVYLDNYAMSNEISYDELAGIGTLCHEFSHVLGLPDFYDTGYGTNYLNGLTPNEWDVMDGGAYNGDGHCPPNYSPWEKYFFGWTTVVNPGSAGRTLRLHPNGSEGYQSYQVNEEGQLQSATTEGLCYYLESRHQQGWDEYLPAEGLLIWKVDFNAVQWVNNTPNNTSRRPRYTIVCSHGSRIGSSNGRGNVFPYIGHSSTVESWEGVTGKPLTDITKNSDGTVTLNYISAGQGFESVEDGKKAHKIIHDGRILILREDQLYDLNGRRYENHQL